MTDLFKFENEARTLLGPQGFTTDSDLLDAWLTDWRGRFTGAAIGMASPANTAEVSEFVQLCAAHRVPIVPQGGNSGMSGGATPDESGNSVILSLRRMDRVREFEPRSMQITCEAGMVLQKLHEAVAEKGLRFPLTLGGKGSATIGGLISTNAGGTQVLRHGTMRMQVLGLEAVLADGSIFDSLTPLKKDNRGFDLKQMLIGSEGTLGIVTGATLRLLPQIKDRVTVWAGIKTIGKARELLVRCQQEAGSLLEGFEVLPAHCLQSVLRYVPDARSPLTDDHQWHALVELVSEQQESASSLRGFAENLFAEAMADGLLDDAAIAANDKQAEDFWLLRDSISPAERAIGPAMQHDISVPVARMPEFIEAVSREVEERFPGTRAIGFGHLGDGNIHYHVLAPEGAAKEHWEHTDGKEISAFVHDRVTALGGSISAEHGIGQVKRDELGRLGDPVALMMMRSVKRALDPQQLLNPGKLVPLAKEGSNP